jgi:hypothetical protein
MTVSITLTAISLFVAAVLTGLIAMMSVAIRKEDKNLTLAAMAPGNLTRMARRLTGVHVRHRALYHDS